MLLWLAVIIAALAALLLALQSQTGSLDNLPPLLIAAGVIATLLLFYITLAKARSHEPVNVAVRIAVLVAGLGAVLAGVYVFGAFPLLRTSPAADAFKAEGSYATAGPAAVRLRRRPNGIFLARGDINGASIDLIVDTGAAIVMLKPSDAEKAGIDVKRLSFTTPVETAGGTIYAAPVRLRVVAVGAVGIDDVEALVAKPGSLNESLLGMNFLRRLASYDLSGDFLTLRK